MNVVQSHSYDQVMSRRNEILKKSLGVDYDKYKITNLAFDYEAMLDSCGSIEDIIKLQKEANIGDTPLLELKYINKMIRKIAAPGKGARLYLKDEAVNPSGSFKVRRASVSVEQAMRSNYKGVVAATSGNYGAAVASQAARKGMNCIILQETFDSKGVGQPEILEKGRLCEAYGAEVLQLTVGPELFYYMLLVLEETGYYCASLYTPSAIVGIETLGYEIVQDVRQATGKDPDYILVTHAGGGNLTGTARGAYKAGATNTRFVGVSVDIKGLHMASDNDFNKKSFTTGHTGFSMPFTTDPDRVDVPKNAARPLRYLDQFVTVTQGEVFYVTELLAKLEGLERGPAGNTSLAAAVAMAKELDEDNIVVIQETEYTGAGKHPSAQLTFARDNGIVVKNGQPNENIPGIVIAIPENLNQLSFEDINMDQLRLKYIKNALAKIGEGPVTLRDVDFLAAETKTSKESILLILAAKFGISQDSLKP